jgi:hypothetical protein
MTVLPFAAFEPDNSGYDSQVTAAGANALPAKAGWVPAKGFAAGTLTALSGTCRGFHVLDYNGVTRYFAALSNDLLEYNTGTLAWDSIKGALTINLADGVTVKFDRRGDWLRACDSSNKLMRFDLTDATSPVFVTTADAPSGLIQVGSYFDLTVGIFNINDQGYYACSDTDDDTNWSTGLALEQPLPGGGKVTGMAIGEKVMVFQSRKLHRLSYTSDATLILVRDEIDTGRGALGPDGVCVGGNRVFFVGVDGFYYSDWSGAVYPIGQDRVNEFFLDRCSSADRAYVLTFDDPLSERVAFAYLASESADGIVYSEALVYDYGLDRWSPPVERDLQAVAETITGGLTLEQIGADAAIETLEVFDRPLDSRDLLPSDGILGAFNNSNTYGTLEGTNLAATLRTAPYLEPEGRRMRVNGAFPVGNGMPENWTMAVGTKERLSDEVTWSSATAPEDVTGMAMFHVSGRSIEFEIVVPAEEEWTRLEKVDVKLRPEGWR